MVCLVLLAAGATAQTKVVDKSAKKMPAWANTAVPDYLIVSVTAPTLAEAQKKSVQEITERIIQSVATSVSVSQTDVMSEVTTDGGVESTDAYKRVSKMKSANLPFLKGISPTKIEEIYWQKVQDKSTKKEHYEYWVKYPYSAVEQRRLQKEFEQLDKEKTEEYEALRDKIGNLESVEEIKSSINRLASLKEFFFDDVRVSQVDGLIEQYKQLYSTMAIHGTPAGKGKYECQMMLNGRPVKVGVVPKVTSNCAFQIVVRQSDGKFIITYDDTDCLPEEENYLDVLFRIDGKRVESKFSINTNSTDGKFLVVPEGTVVLAAKSVSAADRKIKDISIRLTLNNRGGQPFGLKSLELQVPELSVPIVFDDINSVYTTKGVIQVNVVAEGEFTARQKKSSALSFVQGAVMIVNPQTQAVERVRLSLPYVTNWE